MNLNDLELQLKDLLVAINDLKKQNTFVNDSIIRDEDVIEATKLVLIENKSKTLMQLNASVLSVLRKKYGGSKKNRNTELTSKTLFTSRFKQITSTIQFKKIFQITNKKYSKRKSIEIKNIYNTKLSDLSITEANDLSFKLLQQINERKLEVLVQDLLSYRYKYLMKSDSMASRGSGDGGIDFYGERVDKDDNTKVEVLIAEVKKHKNKIDRTNADKFYGAVYNVLREKKNISKVSCIYISINGFSDSFKEYFKGINKPGFTFTTWDGEMLARKMVSVGRGFAYNIDVDNWLAYDDEMLGKLTELK